MTKQNIGIVIAILAMVIAGVAMVSGNSENQNLSGTTEFQKKSFVEGLFAGVGKKTQIDRDGQLALNDVALKVGKDNPLQTATTTVCSLQSPTTATSTLLSGSIHFDRSSTTASTITIAKSTNGTASSTILGNQVVVAANAQATLIASTTATQAAAQAQVFAPGQYLVVTMTGGTGTFSPTGSCYAIWVETE